MKPKKKPTDYELFAEACRAKLMEVGGKTICPSHPRGPCRADVKSESRAGAPGGRSVVLQEYDVRRYLHQVSDVRELAGEAGVAAIPPSESEAEQILQKYGLSRANKGFDRPLSEAMTPWAANARATQAARDVGTPGYSSAVADLLERLDRVDIPAEGLHARLAAALGKGARR